MIEMIGNEKTLSNNKINLIRLDRLIFSQRIKNTKEIVGKLLDFDTRSCMDQIINGKNVQIKLVLQWLRFFFRDICDINPYWIFDCIKAIENTYFISAELHDFEHGNRKNSVF